MLTTVADFLKTLMDKEKELLLKYKIIEHGPTIGDMYEGLTKDLLKKSIFTGLDIRVVSGKIRNKDGEFSHEVDCMIVEGDGEPIPYTDKFIYELSQVIAVIEVKKTLHKQDLTDSYKKMHRIYDINNLEVGSLNMRGFRDSFRHIVQKELPNYDEVEALPFHEQMIYHTLLIEDTMPVRIVFGYYGYKSEFSLREAFVKYIEEEAGNKGFSPTIFPDLIICGNSSLMKLDAMPYISPINEDGYWMFYGSTTHNPILILLEFVWTKLSYKYNIDSSIFGDDLEFEAFHPLLAGKAMANDAGIKGWQMKYISIKREDLDHEPVFYEWAPAELNEPEFVIISWLCNHGSLDVSEPGFTKWLSDMGIELNEVVESLRKKRLIYFHNDRFTLLTDKCVVFTVNGKWYAGENKSGRITNWINKQLQKNDSSHDT